MKTKEKESLKLALDFYHTRDKAREALAEKYDERVKPYRALIKSVMEANSISETAALMKIRDKTPELIDHPMKNILFTAAVCDMVQERARQ